MQLILGLKASSSASASEVTSASAVAGGAAPRDAQLSPPMSLPEAPIPAKARSKRSRADPCSWSSRLLVLSPTTAVTEHDVFVPVSSSPSPCLPAKKLKKKDPSETAASDGRRCLHCATDKTPQWRMGPTGPKTLCNACGVQYRSGRLVPEYRPAASTDCSWYSRLLVLSPTTAATEHDVSVPVSSSPSPCLPAKKLKKKDPLGMATSDGRRCLHCATNKTPQWRMGPMGPNTLCNACGVRYRSGRLVPEYRPAASSDSSVMLLFTQGSLQDGTTCRQLMQEIPAVAKFLDKGLLFADDVDYIFGDMVATGQDTRAPSLRILLRFGGIGHNAIDLEGLRDNDDMFRDTEVMNNFHLRGLFEGTPIGTSIERHLLRDIY